MSHGSPDNPHLPGAPLSRGSADAPLAVIALHGRSQSTDFIGGLIDGIGVAGLRWEAPAAHGNEWYRQRFMDSGLLGAQSLEQALEVVTVTAERLEEEGFPRERIVLLGFSQGACLASQWALDHPGRYGGLVLFTGGYIGQDGSPPRAAAGDFHGTPVLITGPQDDPWVPLSRMQETEQHLRSRGARVTALYLPPGEHAVTAGELRLTSDWLRDAVRDAGARSGSADLPTTEDRSSDF